MRELVGQNRCRARTDIQDVAIEVTAQRAVGFDLHADSIEDVSAFFKHHGTDGPAEAERAGIYPGIERNLRIGLNRLGNCYRVIIPVQTKTLINFASGKGRTVLECAVIMANNVGGVSVARPPSGHSARGTGAGYRRHERLSLIAGKRRH